MDLTKDNLTAVQARQLADNSSFLFNDIMKYIRECALRSECVLVYSLQKLYVSEVALKNAIDKLVELGYKIDKQYSSYEIRVEW